MKDISDLMFKGGRAFDSDNDDRFNRRLIIEKSGNVFPVWTSFQVKVGLGKTSTSEVRGGLEPSFTETYTRRTKINLDNILTEEMKEKGWKWATG